MPRMLSCIDPHKKCEQWIEKKEENVEGWIN